MGWLFKIALTAVLLLLAWSALAWWLAERLIVQRPFDKADAIVVLGGSATYLERTRKAAELFKAGVSDRLVLTNDGLQSGWSQPDGQNLYFIERARRELVAQGVPPENIEELSQIVSGTKDEALLIGREAQNRGWRRVLIVTSAYHSRRALWLFELPANTGVANERDTEFGVVSPAPGEQTPLPFNWWLSPKGWNMVAGEYLKSAYYMLFN